MSIEDKILLQGIREQKRVLWIKSRPYKPSLALKIVLGMMQHIRCGTCHMVLPDGQIKTFRAKNDPDKVAAILVVHDDRFARKFLIYGTLGFCEAYIDGDWESPDLTSLFILALHNEEQVVAHEWRRYLEGILSYVRRNTRKGSRRNISYHYDLGNRFYSQWLDRSMTYSSAVFENKSQDEDSLFIAQQNKYQHMATMIDLKPDHHVLEIGCGWGGFAEFAASVIGCHVTGLTISTEQYAYAKQRMIDKGLAHLVDIQMCDYRDSLGQYDRIVSIEMFEAVGEEYWDQFFRTIYDRLLPGGIAGMQVITIAERYFGSYRRGADYIQKYIFPGGMLPTLGQLRKHVSRASMQWQREEPIGQHYARTLAEWHQRFLVAWPKIAPLGFDEKFHRMWQQYLCYCEAGFRVGTIDDVQFSFIKQR